MKSEKTSHHSPRKTTPPPSRPSARPSSPARLRDLNLGAPARVSPAILLPNPPPLPAAQIEPNIVALSYGSKERSSPQEIMRPAYV
jgi:hypothetical protein